MAVGDAEQRLTRWQRARRDWPGPQWRDLIVGGGGLVIALVALGAAGFPGGTLEEVGIVGGSALAATLLYPLAQLVWAWLQAPMRMLTEDVIAIRERVEQLQPASLNVPKPETHIDVRLTLMNHKRIGEELLAEAGSAFKPPYIWENWTNDLLSFLAEQSEFSRDDTERFMTAGDGSSFRRMDARLAVVDELIARLREAEK